MTTEYECKVKDKTFYFRVETFNRHYVSIESIDKPGGKTLREFPVEIGLVTWVDDNCHDAIKTIHGRYVVPFGSKYELFYEPTDTIILTIEPVEVMRVCGNTSNKRVKVDTTIITPNPFSQEDLKYSNRTVLYF